jgi:phosphoenolpyruvate-protein phosphotransferase (PTS system enzyme I)
MKPFSGIPVTPGIAIAEAYVIESDEAILPRRTIPEEKKEEEVARIDLAVRTAQAEIDQIRSSAGLGSELRSIFDFHLMMLRDASLLDEIRATIRQRKVAAEYAVDVVFRRRLKTIRGIRDEFFASRDKDILDVERRIRRILLGKHLGDLEHVAREIVLVARDLTPSQTALLPRRWVKGIVTEAGGKTSHTALIARGMGIPCVVGVRGLVPEVNGGDLVVVDGTLGRVIVDPDDPTLEEHRDRQRKLFTEEERLRRELSALPAETPDGHRVRILANIKSPAEAPEVIQLGAEGVGLFRTEFLWAEQPNPGEEEHFAAYRKVAADLRGKPLTIRTFDFGADKVFANLGDPAEKNPSLGCRSIRLAFRHPDLFRTQVRAILRASVFGTVKLMFPMIATLQEARRAKTVVREAKEELRREGQAFDEEIQVGAMIEVPSAALLAGPLARELDFLSIGTNDLIQYTLAVDRVNENVADLYQPTHPAVLQLIAGVIRAGEENGIPVSMCGEMSGDVRYAPMLLGMGLKEFSVAPKAVLDVKRLIRSVTMRRAREIAAGAARFAEATETEAYLDETVRTLVMTEPA